MDHQRQTSAQRQQHQLPDVLSKQQRIESRQASSQHRSRNDAIAYAVRRSLAACLAFACVLLALSPASADEVTNWNRIAGDASAKAGIDPISESRLFAILQISVYDALNASETRYHSVYLQGQSAPGASPDAAVAVAAHTALSELLPASKAVFDAALEKVLQSIAPGQAKQRGIEVGRTAAAASLAARKNDGSAQTVTREPGSAPGEYRPTPPDFKAALLPHWGSVTPFALKSAAQFRPAAPFKVTSPEALADVEEVKAIGQSDSAVRTPEQSEIARYWYEHSVQAWNRIAREIGVARKLDAWENARLLALVNVAMADAFIAGFEAKYHYSYWRPVTAIRESSDKTWMTYLPTPPVPDYPSTHTLLGAAAAKVMARYFGTDFVSFSMTSGAPNPGITRKFWSLSQAARENGASRVFAGVHFENAVTAGYLQGQQIGDWVYEHVLRSEKLARWATAAGHLPAPVQ